MEIRKPNDINVIFKISDITLKSIAVAEAVNDFVYDIPEINVNDKLADLFLEKNRKSIKIDIDQYIDINSIKEMSNSDYISIKEYAVLRNSSGFVRNANDMHHIFSKKEILKRP